MADNQHVKSVILGLYQPKVTKNQSYAATEPFLMKFGTVKKTPVEIGATKMLLMLCPTEFKYRRRAQYTKLVKQACDACKHIGIITGYDDTQIGKNGELKYTFEINPNFFRNNT